MRITTWNVNGLRAIMKKEFFENVNKIQPDVLCLQEIKARPDQLDKEGMTKINNNFSHLVWNPAQRPGYSGTTTWALAKCPEMSDVSMSCVIENPETLGS